MRTNVMRVHMRSGKHFDLSCRTEDSPMVVSQIFLQNTDLEAARLNLDQFIFFTRDIEAIEFRSEPPL